MADLDYVYVLDGGRTKGRFLKIDYFHGCRDDEGPIAQMMDDTDVFAYEMFSLTFIAALMKAWFELRKKKNVGNT